MVKRDPRIDAYIATSADSGRPILTHIGEAVHEPGAEIAETIDGRVRRPRGLPRGLTSQQAAIGKTGKEAATYLKTYCYRSRVDGRGKAPQTEYMKQQ